MNKVFFVALFLGVFTTANAVELKKKTDDECHAEACETVREAEGLFSEAELDSDQLYDTAFYACKG